MGASMKVNVPEFQRLLREHLARTSRSLPVALNSRALAIVAKASKETPRTERERIEQELGVVGYRLVATKRGYSYAQSKRRKVANAVLAGGALVYRIINARLGRTGKKGLYGSKMREAARNLLVKRFRSVGTLKAGWTGAIRTLGKVLGLSFQNEGAAGRVQGRSTVKVATEGWSPSVRIEYVTNSFDAQHQAYIDARVEAAVGKGFEAEAKELREHLRKAIDPAEQSKGGDAMAELRRVMPELKG